MSQEINNEEFAQVVYPDHKNLKSLSNKPKSLQTFTLICMIGALVIAFFGVDYVFNNASRISAQETAKNADLLARPIDLQLPVLTEWIWTSPDDARAYLEQSGLSTIDISTEEDLLANTTYDIFKVPSDLDLGVSHSILNSDLAQVQNSDLVHFLSDSWELRYNSDPNLYVATKAYNFTSPTIEEAIASSVVYQGWDAGTVEESGVDTAGNTYQRGSVSIGDTTYHWRVSAIPLEQMFKVVNLPTKVFYVGASLTL